MMFYATIVLSIDSWPILKRKWQSARKLSEWENRHEVGYKILIGVLILLILGEIAGLIILIVINPVASIIVAVVAALLVAIIFLIRYWIRHIGDKYLVEEPTQLEIPTFIKSALKNVGEGATLAGHYVAARKHKICPFIEFT